MQQLTAGLVFVLIGLVGPGLGIQRWARVRIDPSLVLPLGAAQAAATHWLSLATGWASLFPALIVLSTAGLLRRGELVADAVPARVLRAPAAALVTLLAVTQYGGNRPAADGGFRLDPMGDQPLHAGIAWELTLPAFRSSRAFDASWKSIPRNCEVDASSRSIRVSAART